MEETKKTMVPEMDIVKRNKPGNVNNALLLVVGALIIMSAVQIFQFQRITKIISSGAVKVNAQTSGGGSDLPSQVGGCG